MSWLLDHKRYKKLVKELLYHRSEIEFQEELLEATHVEFENYQHEYAAKYNINLKELRHLNADNIEKHLPQVKIPTVGEEGLVVREDRGEEIREDVKQFGKVYKMIAKKIHPDKFANRLRTMEIEEKEELFKQASTGFENRDWGKMLEVAEQLKVKPFNATELCAVIKKETKKLKSKIQANSRMYSWKFYQCEDNEECKDALMAEFFKFLYKHSA